MMEQCRSMLWLCTSPCALTVCAVPTKPSSGAFCTQAAGAGTALQGNVSLGTWGRPHPQLPSEHPGAAKPAGSAAATPHAARQTRARTPPRPSRAPGWASPRTQPPPGSRPRPPGSRDTALTLASMAKLWLTESLELWLAKSPILAVLLSRSCGSGTPSRQASWTDEQPWPRGGSAMPRGMR